ncbi:hypothetical protein DdX_20877 [Ditylenchus destructor]|uniref:Uncharacterized protein n=1 Tax=Ditylenchus destructor TaxID=166010 RepID=A0AAD4MKJ6_9BILA|nr:hypothetical protein DdX_20877 [Ditylenchus destructor]
MSESAQPCPGRVIAHFAALGQLRRTTPKSGPTSRTSPSSEARDSRPSVLPQLRNNYSKQIPLEYQLDEEESTQCGDLWYRIVYELSAYAVCVEHSDPNLCQSSDSSSDNSSSASMIVFFAGSEFNHENWPLFHNFMRLLTDPCVYFCELGPHLPDEIHQLCKKNVWCDEFAIFGVEKDSNYDDVLLEIILTGNGCREIGIGYYILPEIGAENTTISNGLDTKNKAKYFVSIFQIPPGMSLDHGQHS